MENRLANRLEPIAELGDPSNWTEWNEGFLAALRMRGLSRYVLSDVPEPAGENTRFTLRWRRDRLKVLLLLKRAFSQEMKSRMCEAGWNPAVDKDPKFMYDVAAKVAQQHPSSVASARPLEVAGEPSYNVSDEFEAIDVEDVDDDWTSVSYDADGVEQPHKSPKEPAESMSDRIVRVTQDLAALAAFYNIETSATRYARLDEFYSGELDNLTDQSFDSYTQDDKVDYLLLKNYLTRAQRTLKLDAARDKEFEPFVEPFAAPIKELCEKRQRVEPLEASVVAETFNTAVKAIASSRQHVIGNTKKYSKATGYRAARTVASLQGHAREMYDFYKAYDPSFDWWVSEPYSRFDTALGDLVLFLRKVLVGIKPGNEKTIVGEPIGRNGLLTDLEAEMIPYSPEELLDIAESEYKWCEREMKKASKELGFGDEWRHALEHVKNLYPAPGEQPLFVKSLIHEGAAYVKENNLVTVPPLAEEAIRMYMIPPATQIVSPFFLGGTTIQVSYPTFAMQHEAKLMSMRGNNRHFSKATAFHEMIPGHHLQGFVAERHRTYRQLFDTPFYVEGWALYWEMVFWNRGDFFTSAEDRVGSLFWRMHRCARIVFSVKFHLGLMTAAECVNLLVSMVGHERATAEGEVRRSFNGDYSPLYQAGYMLGALQIMKLRKEAIGERHSLTTEKEFHDTILRANVMPIEMLRALLLKKDLGKDFKSEWRFYD